MLFVNVDEVENDLNDLQYAFMAVVSHFDSISAVDHDKPEIANTTKILLGRREFHNPRRQFPRFKSQSMSSNSITLPTSLATPPDTKDLEILPISPVLIYEPLDVAKLETRILTILPGPPESTIECTLERMCLAGKRKT
ncbi:hypothetical protein BDZ45DRAFT_743121 [Acephala macrosclerotiorum]|nr:hypothetical protein BDZ45DRAFT_743121 [Acephala macrosclerotiorum]